LLHAVHEEGVATRDEAGAAMGELSLVDGVEQGRLDVNVLMGMGWYPRLASWLAPGP
jgi:hypothetical protein